MDSAHLEVVVGDYRQTDMEFEMKVSFLGLGGWDTRWPVIW